MTIPKQFDLILQLADAIVITDSNHVVLAINDTYTKLTGYAESEIIGHKAGQLRTSFTPKSMYVEMKRNLGQMQGWSGIFTNRNKKGELWTSSITITPYIIDGHVYYVGMFRALEHLKRGQYLSERRIIQLQSALLRVLAISCEIRDPAIESHLLRVQQMTELLLVRYMKQNKLTTNDIDVKAIVSASILHDIGKSAIPEGILYKPSALAPHERKIIEMHTYIGIDIFEKIYNELDDELIVNQSMYAKNIIKYHHERVDGTGYPEQLKGEDIPLEARIVSVVDVFDALTTKRPYKDKWTHEQAIAYIIEQKDKQFDAKVVDAFVSLYEEDKLTSYE